MPALNPKTRLSMMAVAGIICGAIQTADCQVPMPGTATVAHPTIASDAKPSLDAGEKIDQVLTHIAFESLPAKFEDTKDWGEQSRRWDGIKWHREGLKFESSRRWKVVNHGTWNKYSATLRNPEDEFSVQIKNMHETEENKIAFEIHVAAHLNIDARQSKWVKGVQLYSVNAQGHAKIRLQISIEMDIRMGVSSFPPDIIMIPKATAAKLEFDEFRIDRISKIGGEFAQQITKHVRSRLDKKVITQEKKIVAKINKQLEKKQDDFRLSIADAMKSPWNKPLNKILTAPDQND